MRLRPLCCGTQHRVVRPTPELEEYRGESSFVSSTRGADVCDRSRRGVLNWAGATLAGAAAFGFDPLSLRLTEALAKNGVVDLGTGDIALLN
jgi:hypothetical protein